MQDTDTGGKIYVSTDGDAGPYIMAPLAQLDDVKGLLQQNDIAFWVEENAISLNDEPYIAVINLSKNVDPAAVQAILDSAK